MNNQTVQFLMSFDTGSTVDGARYEVARDLPMQRAPQHIVERCKPPGKRAENAAVPLVELDTPAAIMDGDGDPITAPVCLERTEDEVRSDRKLKLKKGETTALATLQQMTLDLMPANASPLPPPKADGPLNERLRDVLIRTGKTPAVAPSPGLSPSEAAELAAMIGFEP